MTEIKDSSGGETSVRKMTEDELIQAIRLDIAAEYEAIHRYLIHAEAADHHLASTLLMDIANEERIHVGELERLLELLTGHAHEYLAKGRKQVDRLAEELASNDEQTDTSVLNLDWKERMKSLKQLGV